MTWKKNDESLSSKSTLLNNLAYLADHLGNLAVFEKQSNDSASAKKHWQEALELAKEINHEKWIKDIEEILAE